MRVTLEKKNSKLRRQILKLSAAKGAVEAEAAGNAPVLFPCSHSFPKQMSDLSPLNRNSLRASLVFGDWVPVLSCAPLIGRVGQAGEQSRPEEMRLIRGQNLCSAPTSFPTVLKNPTAPPSEELLPSVLFSALALSQEKLERNWAGTPTFPHRKGHFCILKHLWNTVIVQGLQTL